MTNYERKSELTTNLTNTSLSALTNETYKGHRMPMRLWDEIAPGLWQGGTDSTDTVRTQRFGSGAFITPEDFDVVVTMYSSAQPVDWWVKEIRFGIYDGDMTDFDIEDLRDIVLVAHSNWKRGKRVLVRCQAGLNRSGIVTALVLIREGYSAEEAIQLVKDNRGSAALTNEHFNEWLLSIDPQDWRK